MGNEVSSFLESNALTDKSLRQLEHRLSKILSQQHNVTLDEPSVYHAPEPYFSEEGRVVAAPVATVLPEIHTSKVNEDLRMQEVQAKFNSAFNQISASQEMVSPKVGSPVHARSNQLLPVHTERSSKLDRNHSRIRSNHAFTVQSPPEEKPFNMSVNEWAEVLNYHR